MRNLLTILSCCLWLSMFAQNLEVEGKAKITQMDKIDTADSIVVWLPDSMLGIRDAASLNKQLIDSDGDTKVLVEENPDEDIIRFYNRDSEIMRMDSSGRVGIGTDAPNARLEVDGNASINSSAGSTELLINTPATSTSSLKLFEAGEFGFQFEYDGALNADKLYLRSRGFAGNDAIRMTWLKDGKVGLGTTTPDRELTVFDNNNSGGAVINLRAVNPENREMIIGINQSSGGIFGMLTENDLYLRTNGSNRMVISSDGKVGIGTTSPGAVVPNTKLDVRGGHLALENNYGVLSSNSTGTGLGAGFDTSTDDDLFLFAGGLSHMVIENDGDVGIGTSNPSARLHVDSAVLFTGTLNNANPSPPPASGPGTRLMWYPDKAAFRAGRVYGTEWDSVNIGKFSFATGQGTTALGPTSTAMGNGTMASGDVSTGMGASTTASGNVSTAMGSGTEAAGVVSTAMGRRTAAIGIFSTAMGDSTRASGSISTAMGASTIASGSIATTMGNGTMASGSASTAMGSGTTASGDKSTAMGDSTIALASGSTAMGFQTQANGFASTVLGMYNDTIVGPQSNAEPTTPLLIIGNGEAGAGNESNAMVVRKDGKVGIGTNTPAVAISNALVEIKDGHIALSNNYGVFSNNSTGTGPGAGFDTSMDDDLLLFAGGDERVRIEENGEVGIGTDNPTALLEVNADIVKKVNGGVWAASSDRRLKQDIRDYREGLDKILDLRPVYFHYNEMSGYDTSVEHIGIIAQELQEIAPHMVSSYQKDGDQYLQVDNSAMIYMLVNAVKEQQMTINLLQEEIEKLKEQKESSSLPKSEMN